MFAEGVLRFLAMVLGCSLNVFLIVLLARKRAATRAERLVLAVLGSTALWQASAAVALVQALDSARQGQLAAIVSIAGRVGLALVPTFLAHLGLVWGRLPEWLALPGYAAAPAAWWALRGDSPLWSYTAWLTLAVAGAAFGSLLGAAPRSEGHERRFYMALGAALLATLAVGMLTRVNSTAVAWAAVFPSVLLAHSIYHYNILDLLISRRAVFAATLGLVFALYLVVVRTVAEYVATENEILRGSINLILTFAAGLVWLPLSGWMTRFLARRTRIYTDFSKRLVDDAARILDLRQRLQFLAQELGRTFRFRKVLLVLTKDLSLRGVAGDPAHPVDSTVLRQAAEFAEPSRADSIHVTRSGDPVLRELLGRIGFNHIFPLRYDGRLQGLLLLDSFPRLFLDEDESILVGLGGQISQSIANCLAIEDKIALERGLARQEHLASLGQAAATIAHEIKNPLSSIKTLAQLMREDADVGARFSKDLTYMIGETDRLNRSLQQLLSFSRPAPEREAELDLTSLLESMARFAAPQWREERVSLESAVAPRLYLKQASPEAVKHVVLNLLLNASQAAGPGGTVRLEALQGEDRQIRISVSDDGPGVPFEIQEKVFEPFFTTRQKGTGLGLAIVRKNVRQLGGEIRLESPIQEGRGTRMMVTLPPP